MSALFTRVTTLVHIGYYFFDAIRKQNGSNKYLNLMFGLTKVIFFFVTCNNNETLGEFRITFFRATRIKVNRTAYST